MTAGVTPPTAFAIAVLFFPPDIDYIVIAVAVHIVISVAPRSSLFVVVIITASIKLAALVVVVFLSPRLPTRNLAVVDFRSLDELVLRFLSAKDNCLSRRLLLNYDGLWGRFLPDDDGLWRFGRA